MYNILQDIPIQKEEQDEFGRESLIENIAKSIIDYSKSCHRCTSIGIYGAWGEGKTSVLNLVRLKNLWHCATMRICIENITVIKPLIPMTTTDMCY